MTEQEFIKKATPLYKSIYRRNSGGCCLHVIIDDRNWPEHDINLDELKHKDCKALAALINQLDIEQKERINYDYQEKELTFNEEEEICPCCGRTRNGGY